MRRTGRALDALWAGVRRCLPTGRPDGEPYGATRLVSLWLLTRAISLLIIVLAPAVVSDLGYYVRALNGGMDGMAEGLREYPLPAAWLLELPDLVARADVVVYPLILIAAFVVADGLFTLYLHRCCPADAVTVWLAAAVLVGPLLYTRFDILTGAAVAVGVLSLARRPRTAALLVSAAALLKLWPAVLLPALASPRGTRRTVVLTAAAALAVALVAVLAVSDPDRLLSPLRYQSDRGLQVESLAALPLMAAWAVVHEPWSVYLSDFMAVEIHGPGDTALIAFSSLLTLAALAAIAVVAVRLWRTGGGADGSSVAWAFLSAATLLVLANKVFSPQYVIWLIPAAIAVVALDDGRAARRCATALLAAGAVGQLIYPALYGVVAAPHTANLAGTALLALRLALVAVVAAVALREAWRRSAPLREPVPA